MCKKYAYFTNFLSVYGISNFGTKVEPLNHNYPNELLKFEIKMFNFKAKSLPEDKVMNFITFTLHFMKKLLPILHLFNKLF